VQLVLLLGMQQSHITECTTRTTTRAISSTTTTAAAAAAGIGIPSSSPRHSIFVQLQVLLAAGAARQAFSASGCLQRTTHCCSA
jgi:hypothetical protein